jgi:hypothetical protein
MFTLHNRSDCQSIFSTRIVRELRVIPDPTVADGVPATPATPIVEPSKSRKAVYLPGERLLKKLNKDRDKGRKKKKVKVNNLGEDDVERLAVSITSVLASLNI